jgi:hypothetical protein
MALFSKGGQGTKPQDSYVESKVPVPPQHWYCRICDARMVFTHCWKRQTVQAGCKCCGTGFEFPEKHYKSSQPRCPKCEEYLEQPGFEYGICDGCGSKFELLKGTPANLLPNAQQREEMNKVGKITRLD